MLLLLPGSMGEVLAQNGRPNVIITSIDSSAFPQVTAYVTVTDADGLPIPDLTAADFAVLEDGQPVNMNLVAVEAVPLSSRYVVLAVDVSTFDNLLPELQAAARAFVNQMEPEDRVSLVALHDIAEVLTPFTNNTQTLLAAIDGMTLTGNYTALNTTVTQAAQMVEQYPPGHRALILVPDSRNNIAPRSAEEAINTVRQVGVPLYIIGAKTEKISLADLEEFATQTVGQVTVVEPNQVQGELLALAERLPLGYRLTYRSQTPADDAEHTLEVAVAANGQLSALAEGDFGESRFVANSAAVLVSFPELTSGQTVGGQVPVAVETQSIAPLEMVEYLLNGQPITALTAPPFGFTWDTTQVPPGVYTLTASATDQAGNQGLTDITLNIVPPVRVAMATTQTVVAVGDDVPIEVRIETLNEISRVELLVDGSVIETDTMPPFSFSFDSSRTSVGHHVISVRAVDRLGYTAQDDLTIEFLPAWREWLRKFLGIEDRARFDAWLLFVQQAAIVAGAALLMLLLILLALLLLRALRQRFLARSLQTVGVAVLNYGNIPSRYTLWATEPNNRLKFKFTLDGQDLQMQQVTQVVAPARVAVPERVAEPAAAPVPALQPAGGAREPMPTRIYTTISDSDIAAASAGAPADADSPGGPETTRTHYRSDMSDLSDKAGQAAQKTRKFMGLAGIVGNILLTMARVLPTPLARPLQNLSNSMRGGTSRVQRSMQMPAQIRKASSSVKQQAGSLKKAGASMPGSGGSSSPAAASATAQTSPAQQTTTPAATSGAPATQQQMRYSPRNGQNSHSTAAVVTPPVTRSRTIRLDKAQTPPIEPGETLVADMIITPEQPFKRRDYPVTVYAVAVEQPEVAPVIEEGTIHVPGMWWIFRFIPALLVWLVTLLLLLAVAWGAAWLLGIDLMDYFYQFT